MAGLNFRGSNGLTAIIAQAQGTEGGNQSAAIRALILLGADRLGYDLSAVQHEIIMLMMEQIDPAIIEELGALSGVPRTLPKRPARERVTRARSTRRRESAPGAPTSDPHPGQHTPPLARAATHLTAEPTAIAGTPPADLAAEPGRYDVYDVGEEI